MARKKTADATAKNAERAAVQFGPLEGWVGFNLRMAQESAFAAFSHLSREIGESPGRFATLTLIAENPGISQSTLGHAAGRDKSSLTPVLDDLCRQGYVTRERLETDRRSYALKLTPKGKAAEAKLLASAMAHERDIDRIVGTHRAQFVRILKNLAATLAQNTAPQDSDE